MTSFVFQVFDVFLEPSKYPTPVCDEFWVGRSCDFSIAIDLDLVIVMDNTNDLKDNEFDLFISSLSEAILEYFPHYNERFGFVTYASDEVKINLSIQSGSPEFFSEEVKVNRLNGSDRQTSQALWTVFNNVWTLNHVLNPGNF